MNSNRRKSFMAIPKGLDRAAPITAPERERPCECRTTLGTLTVDWGIRSVFRGKLRQRVIGYVEVGRDILDIIMIIQGFHQFQHLAAGIRV